MLAASEEPEAQQCSFGSAGALAGGHVLFALSPLGSQVGDVCGTGLGAEPGLAEGSPGTWTPATHRGWSLPGALGPSPGQACSRPGGQV